MIALALPLLIALSSSSSSSSSSTARCDELELSVLQCARAHASEGEIVESLQRVFGTYTETPVF